MPFFDGQIGIAVELLVVRADIGDHPTGLEPQHDMRARRKAALEGIAKELIRKAITLSTKLEDADTADIFTQVSRGADMNLWFVEAHEQDQH